MTNGIDVINGTLIYVKSACLYTNIRNTAGFYDMSFYLQTGTGGGGGGGDTCVVLLTVGFILAGC